MYTDKGNVKFSCPPQYIGLNDQNKPIREMNTLEAVDASVSKSTINRRLHWRKCRGFTSSCNPLVSIKIRKKKKRLVQLVPE